ncbi:ribosome biogenesis ATPase RIX7 [Rhypophila decipiens]|uniref:Ribosome biogenesis ATPase RIX7 n=1 Tax=Rhypophila decipiens TaxID=261697 RepID=A0AAN7B608_9PEZI|nr:ribosome biogenesis ATPase RIX7 [Rhypophila decipiens]
MSRLPQLRHGLDREVYHAVVKMEDELLNEGKNPPQPLTIKSVYDTIKKSNSSLARQKKRPLEDAIERVLAVRKEELKVDAQDDSDDALSAAEGKVLKKRKAEESPSASLNLQIAKSWRLNKSSKSFSSEILETPSSSHLLSSSSQLLNSSSQPRLQTSDTTGGDRQQNMEPRSKKRKAKEVDRSPPTGIDIRDIAGLEDALNRLFYDVSFPLQAEKYWEKKGIRACHALLLHGPSGCGKTALVHAVAATTGVAFIPVEAQSIVDGTSGASEKNIREVFDEAIRLAPCLLFIDEIDAIAGNSDNISKAMEGRMVAELKSGMDRVKRDAPIGKNVIVLAATTKPESLDHAIRRRFDHELDIGMPNEPAREQILRSMTRGFPLGDDVNFKELARSTPGFVGSDLKTLVSAAVSECTKTHVDQVMDTVRARRPSDFIDLTGVRRNFLLLRSNQEEEWDTDNKLTQQHFKTAISCVQPASRREGFSTIPDTTWADVGALDEVRKKLEMSIIGPIKKPELFAMVGIKPAAGILLWGPPGCGKTLVAKAVANESQANFISIKGPELLNKYVGESERAVRQLFGRARSSAPCVLFFDEMDALVPKRGNDSSSDASARVVNALLTELDGVGDRSGVYVIGATNRPDIIDDAMRRPGRLGTSIYVGLPSASERVAILKTLYRNTISKARKVAATCVSSDVPNASTMPSRGVELDEKDKDMRMLDAVALDPRCNGFSGADLGNLLHSAAQFCLERALRADMTGMAQGEAGVETPVITEDDWEKALNTVKPSVKDIDNYEYLE